MKNKTSLTALIVSGVLLLASSVYSNVKGAASVKSKDDDKPLSLLELDNQVLQILLQKKNRSDDSIQLQKKLAVACLKANLQKLELKIVRRLLDKDPDNTGLKLRKYLLLLQDGDEARSRQAINKMLKKHPENKGIIFFNAVIAMTRGRIKKAATLFDSIPDYLAENIARSMAQAEVYAKTGQYRKARAVYQRVAQSKKIKQMDLDSEDKRMLRQAHLMSDKKYKFKGSDPYSMFVSISSESDLAKRFSAYQMLFKRYPDYYPAYADYAGLLMFKGDRASVKQAIRLIKKAAEHVDLKRRYSFYNNLAAAYMRTENYKLAAKAARNAIKIEGDFVAEPYSNSSIYDADYILGQALFNSKEYAAAYKAFERGFRLAPEKGIPYDYNCYLQILQKKDKQREFHRVAGKFYKNHAANPYALYWQTISFMLKKQYGDALGMLLRIIPLLSEMAPRMKNYFTGEVRRFNRIIRQMAAGSERGTAQDDKFRALNGLMRESMSFKYRHYLLKKALQTNPADQSLKVLGGVLLWNHKKFTGEHLKLFPPFSSQVEGYAPLYCGLGLMLYYEGVKLPAEYFLLRTIQMVRQNGFLYRRAGNILEKLQKKKD